MHRLPVRLLALVLLVLSLFVVSSAAEAQLVKKVDGQIRVVTPDIPEAYVNPWPKSQEDAYWDRAQPILAKNVGKIRTDTPGEHEKWSIPQTLLAYLAGVGDEKALDALHQGPGDGDHKHTSDVDLYWSFTLKGQARKYFFLKDALRKDYVKRYFEGAKAWTSGDVKPNMELVMALDSPDPAVRKLAAEMLQKMRLRLTAEVAEKATNAEAKAAILEYLKSDLAKGDYGDDIKKWEAWWSFFSKRGWKAFEEVERLMNIRPHPKYGIGTGPVGGAWDPKIRGFWADARNTDNLRGMREVAAYLFAEETGNEEIRKLYKEKIRDTARGFLGRGMGEWDSEGYHGHSVAAYLNLYDFAKDKQVKGFAKAILDYLYACGAVKYFHGSWGGPVKRDYGNVAPWSTAAATFYPYYGAAPKDKAHSDLEHAFVLTSSYRPPMALVKMAEKNHKQPYELLNSHPTYEAWLPGNDDEPLYYETMYYGDTYQLGSLINGSDGYDTCGFKLLMENKEGTADFVLMGTTSKNQVVRNDAVSSVRGDRIAQYQNLVLLLNGSKPTATFFVLVPEKAKIETSDGVTLVQAEKTWLALRAVNGGELAKGKVRPKKGGLISLSTSGKGDVAGLAMIVGDEQSYGSFGKFKQAVAKGGVAVDGKKATLTDGAGKSLAMAYSGAKLPNVWRNGKQHDWSKHMAVYQPADGSKAPLYLGWKERVLHASAGGYSFRGELKDDDSYVTTNSGPGIE